MREKRIKIEVEVNLDRSQIWGHRRSDYVQYIQRLLDQTIPNYDPKVVKVEEVSNDVAS